MEHAFADGGDAGCLVDWARQKTHSILEIVRHNPIAKSFEVLPCRWLVERTSAWIIKNRRFVHDYGRRTPLAETMIIIAAAATVTRR